MPRRVISKARESALALAQPPADAMAEWYLRRVGRRLQATQEGLSRDLVDALRPVLRAGVTHPGGDGGSALEALVTESFHGLSAQRPDGQPNPAVRDAIVEQFHRLYYNDPGTWLDTRWLGVPAWKCPLDLWVYQEIIQELRPALIVECGTAHGGSAYFLASICDLLGSGEIVTIDVETKPGRPIHPRITYILGSSVDSDVIAQVQSRVPATGNVLVILDSDHRAPHVERELSLYSGMVTLGSYLIVEDTNINNHPVGPGFGPGPMEAVSSFLETNHQFLVDEGRQKYHLTFNPRGFLRRVSPP
ncbi:MAG: CmcI family methyltransferase [Candidatus Dormibacteria bacterium]